MNTYLNALQLEEEISVLESDIIPERKVVSFKRQKKRERLYKVLASVRNNLMLIDSGKVITVNYKVK